MGNEKRLIDANGLVPELVNLALVFAEIIEAVENATTKEQLVGTMARFAKTLEIMMVRISELPTEDAVPVVRCGNCKHFREPFCCRRDDETHRERINMLTVDFCSYGERRNDNA